MTTTTATATLPIVPWADEVRLCIDDTAEAVWRYPDLRLKVSISATFEPAPDGWVLCPDGTEIFIDDAGLDDSRRVVDAQFAIDLGNALVEAGTRLAQIQEEAR